MEQQKPVDAATFVKDILVFFVVLGMEPKTFYTLSKCSTNRLNV